MSLLPGIWLIYFAVFADFIFGNNALYVYFLVLVKWIHLEGLNLICHVFAEFFKVERSF